MNLKGKKIGFAVTGSFCTLARALTAAEVLREEGADLYPVFSEAVQTMDTKFGQAVYWEQAFKDVSGRKIIKTVVDAEPIGPGNFLDCMVVAPCSGNTLSKLAGGITDSSVLMAVKAHLRNGRPTVLAISTNDGLSKNLQNIASLLNSKNIYLVPFSQDDPVKKPYSLVALIEKTKETVELALDGEQIQPVIAK